MRDTTTTRRKPTPIRFILADSLCVKGQHLRAAETACVTTFALSYAARRVAALPHVTKRK